MLNALAHIAVAFVLFGLGGYTFHRVYDRGRLAGAVQAAREHSAYQDGYEEAMEEANSALDEAFGDPPDDDEIPGEMPSVSKH